jgi:hypothetical protein
MVLDIWQRVCVASSTLPPTDFNDLLANLPFRDDGVPPNQVYVQNVKEMISNYEEDLERKNEEIRGLGLIFESTEKLFKNVLRYQVHPSDVESLKKNDVRRTWQNLKKLLGGRGIKKIIQQEERREKLLNQILGTATLPRD